MDKSNEIAPHLSVGELKAYLSGQLSDGEMHRIERHLLSCSLCAEAAEGLSPVTAEAFAADQLDLEQRLKERVGPQASSPKAWPFYQIAAAVAIILFSGLAVYFFTVNSSSTQSELALETDQLESVSDQPKQSIPESESAKKSNNLNQPERATEASPQKPNETGNDAVGASSTNGYIAQRKEAPGDNEDKEASRTVPIATPKSDIENQAASGVVAEVAADEEDLELEDTRAAAPQTKARSQFDDSSLERDANEALPQAIVPPSPSRTIAGKVISSKDGSPLKGIKIAVKGTRIDTYTDNEGDYIITAPVEAQTLVMSYQGYQSQEVPLEVTEDHLDERVADAISSEIADLPSFSDSLNLGVQNLAPLPGTEPFPKGGYEAFYAYLQEEEARERISFNLKKGEVQSNESPNQVRVTFLVQTDGSLSDFELLDGAENTPCTTKAITRIKNGPQWTPGTIDAKKQVLPIVLSLPCDL